MTLTVDVMSDVICPWCYIGKRRLAKAIAAQLHEVRVCWFPFQLNPTMPKEGISRQEYRTRKFGSWERSLELDGRVIEVGKSEAINFAFDRIERTPNTLDAHRLIWLADKQGVQEAVVEALFRAYFTEGRDISNRQTLMDVVAEAGLDRARAEGVLNSDDGLEAIKKADGLARRFRVEGVPFFIVNGKVTLSGACFASVGIGRCPRCCSHRGWWFDPGCCRRWAGRWRGRWTSGGAAAVPPFPGVLPFPVPGRDDGRVRARQLVLGRDISAGAVPADLVVRRHRTGHEPPGILRRRAGVARAGKHPPWRVFPRSRTEANSNSR